MAHTLLAGLQVDIKLVNFVEEEALAGSGVSPSQFWEGLARLVDEAAPRNRALLDVREEMQTKIDDWHDRNGAVAKDASGYRAFLREIGYIVEQPDDFQIDKYKMDPEISNIAGPQLVVPVSNARYALNAANARWGSLFDALYGTDAVSRKGTLAPGKSFNQARGAEVFARAAKYLDQAFPLKTGKHHGVVNYHLEQADEGMRLSIELADGSLTRLNDESAFVGYTKTGDGHSILLCHHGLHMELLVDRSTQIGATHNAGLADVIVESALSTIQDCEDSVAAVDAEEKIGVYRNWLGLMTGDLSESFQKGDRLIERRLNEDRAYVTPHGAELILKGRALLLLRNVGHLMTTDMVLDGAGNEVGEGIIDAAVCALCGLHDLQKQQGPKNSDKGFMYFVKPKMHGPDEVRLACDIFAMVEEFLDLPSTTIKIGIMDEERRTSANLKACIYEARDRLFFINTGFLDRTGDEIHTSLHAGPVPPKGDIKNQPWIASYEDRNVLIGLECGLSGVAQIGKGMWAMPDDMADMLASKAAQPNQGANCAWVPSPTAATLHALHYHEVDVFSAQKRRHNEATPGLDVLFSMSTMTKDSLSQAEITRELENNAQGILGYVVRWIDHGVGCSKVPDINDVGLMEDRATLRISSQHISNWLMHNIVSPDEVDACFKRMALVVDGQNKDDVLYQPMAEDFENSVAFQASLELALCGAEQPSGYTEPILHRRRAELKAG